jgi:RHS repeat-associated protein
VHDALGSVRATLNDSGTALGSMRYDPWGQPQTSAIAPFGFTGEFQDSTSVYLRARWYNPSQGTLTSRDPFAGFPETPYSLHPYQYAYSDPVRFTDPSGLCVAYGNNDCALITTWAEFETSFPFEYHQPPALSASQANVGSSFDPAHQGSVSLRVAAEMAAAYEVFLANPQAAGGHQGWMYPEAEIFSQVFLRRPLYPGSMVGDPADFYAELDCLNANYDGLSNEQWARRTQLLFLLGLVIGRDGVLAPDTGGGSGGGGIASGLDDLAQRRQSLNIPSVGTDAGEKVTLARLDVNGEQFYGRSGAKIQHPSLPPGNYRSTGHAEWDAFGYASEHFPGGVNGGKATLYVDREPCAGCKSNFGTWSRHLGIEELEVISRNGYRGSWSRATNSYRTLK